MSETTTTPELETLLVQSKVREEVRKRAADLRVSEDFPGLLITNARGKSRYMTWRERLSRWLLKGALEIRP